MLYSFLSFLLVGHNLEASRCLVLWWAFLGNLTPTGRHITTSRHAANGSCIGGLNDTFFGLLATSDEFLCETTTIHQCGATVNSIRDELLVGREVQETVEKVGS
jgi:hypothetical protein